MKIEIEKNNEEITIKLDGRLDTNTAPNLEEKFAELTCSKIILDLKKLDYISSAGLRVLLSMQKVMNKKDGMELINVNNNVLDVFEVTGFDDVLNIKGN